MIIRIPVDDSSDAEEVRENGDDFVVYSKILREQNVIERILTKDPLLWTEIGISQSEIPVCVNWVDAFERSIDEVKQHNLAAKQSLLLIGMGGASLAAEVYGEVFGSDTGCMVYALSSTHPQSIAPYLKGNSLQFNSCVVSSKSGNTIESLDLSRTLVESLNLPADKLTAITDPMSSKLRDWASSAGVSILDSDPSVPGRFSALSKLGLIPASLLGVDLTELYYSYQQYKNELRKKKGDIADEVMVLAAALATLCKKQQNTITVEVRESPNSLSRWIEQLVAESLGKHNQGVLCVIKELSCDEDTYDELPDKVTLGNAEVFSEVGGAKFVHFQTFESKYDLSRYFFKWELAVAAAGFLLGINPFDQPDVEGNKTRVDAVLKDWPPKQVDEDSRQTDQVVKFSMDSSKQDFVQLFSILVESVSESEYLSILAFIDPTAENKLALIKFRQTLDSLVLGQVICNFGPQYLHSTGQYFKGGRQNGHFLMLTSEVSEDIEVSSKPYRFGDLIELQATADYDALRTLGRPVYQIKLNEPVVEVLDEINQSLVFSMSNAG